MNNWTNPKQPDLCCFEITPPLENTLLLLRITPCGGKAVESGFCTEHAYAARLLEQARYYGCPELKMLHVEKQWNKETGKQDEHERGFIIGQGHNGWLGYCERATPEHARMVAARLEVQCGGMYGEKGVA